MHADIKYQKIIGDPLHGYIPLTRLEYDVLQLPTLNRLHHVRQNAMAFLAFPGSVTTRFGHIVGALHIGGKLIDQILSDMEKADFEKLFPEISSPEFIVKSVRLACLLHDIGHGPFSHSAEEAMLRATKRYHPEEIDEAKKLFNQSEEHEIPIHEFFSYKLATEGEVAEEIRRSKSEQDSDELVNSVSELLVKSNNGGFINANPNGYRLIRKLVSSQLDADRMDYLVRDSTMSGVKFGLVDVDRIIKNMTIMRKSDQNFELVIHERALAAIEDMLDARYKMYRWFTMHHTVVVTNELLKIAIDKMTSEDEKIERLFHWSSYNLGYSTDDYILSKITDRLNNDLTRQEYQVVKGLIDRRYMPISFFKSPLDMGRFVAEVARKVNISEDVEVTHERILRFFNDNQHAEKVLRDRLQKLPDVVRQCIIRESFPPIKTYKPFSKDDKVFLYRTEKDKIGDLLSVSPYFKKVNEEWANYRNIYLFYLIPGSPKETFAKYKDELLKIIVDEIARI